MGLVNDLNYQLESEKVSVRGMFEFNCNYVYCVCSLNYSKVYGVFESYNVAKYQQKLYKVNTAIWYTEKEKAKNHFLSQIAKKNDKKRKKQEKKEMNETIIIEKVNNVNDLETFYKNLNFACEYQKSLQRKEKMRLNGERNIPFFPFVDGIDIEYKKAYFHYYLQCFGGC